MLSCVGIKEAMFEYQRDTSNVFAVEGQLLFVTEDKPKGKQLVRLHLTDAQHEDDFKELAQVWSLTWGIFANTSLNFVMLI